MLARITSSGDVVLLAVAQEEDHEEESDAGRQQEEDHAGEADGEEEELHTGTEAEGHGAEESNPILPATNELIYAILAFAVLFALMYTKAFPAVKKTMEARTNRIRDNLDEADRTRAEAQTILEDYQRQLADARNESSRIIEEARQTADQLRRDLMARAEADVAELRQRNTEELASAQERALADLRAQVATLAMDVAERVVQRNLDRETNQALVESFIRDVTSNQAGATS